MSRRRVLTAVRADSLVSAWAPLHAAWGVPSMVGAALPVGALLLEAALLGRRQRGVIIVKPHV